MASSNLELAQTIYAAWERGDWSSIEWADPEIELVFADGPERGTWTGLASVARAWRDFLDSWQDWRIVVEGYRELDHERMLVLVHNSGGGKGSGVGVEPIAA